MAVTCVPSRLAYFGFRYDAKARVQCNFFERWYQCRHLCEQCMSQRPTPKHDPNMNYQNFKDTCPRYLTYLTDKDYRDTSKRLSPWTVMEGWHLLSCFHDAMHTIFLGIGRDIVSNILADMLDCGVLGPGTLDEQLRRLSLEMHSCFKKEKSFGLRLIAFFGDNPPMDA